MLLLIFILITINLSIIYFNFQKIKLYFLNLSNLEKILFVLFVLIFNLFFFFFIIIYLKTSKLLAEEEKELKEVSSKFINEKKIKNNENGIKLKIVLSEFLGHLSKTDLLYLTAENTDFFFHSLTNQELINFNNFLTELELKKLTFKELVDYFNEKKKIFDLINQLIKSQTKKQTFEALEKKKLIFLISNYQNDYEKVIDNFVSLFGFEKLRPIFNTLKKKKELNVELINYEFSIDNLKYLTLEELENIEKNKLFFNILIKKILIRYDKFLLEKKRNVENN